MCTNFLTGNGGDRRFDRTQQKRTGDLRAYQRVSENAFLQRLYVDNDIRQLRHLLLLRFIGWLVGGGLVLDDLSE